MVALGDDYINMSTDPTYKEWKRDALSLCAVGLACTDPTYKEWKLFSVVHEGNYFPKHGSYLQGMETK